MFGFGYRQQAAHKRLKPNQTAYVTQTNTGRRGEFQFSKNGNPYIESAYRTHYIFPLLSMKWQQKIQEKLNKPPELVVLIIAQEIQCSRRQKELSRSSFLLPGSGSVIMLKLCRTGRASLFTQPQCSIDAPHEE